VRLWPWKKQEQEERVDPEPAPEPPRAPRPPKWPKSGDELRQAFLDKLESRSADDERA
jgi:hypothetical protein